MSKPFDFSKLSDDVDAELDEELYKKAKKELKAKRIEINTAEKIVRQLKLEEKDIVARLSEGV